jgi:hypothetical protein
MDLLPPGAPAYALRWVFFFAWDFFVALRTEAEVVLAAAVVVVVVVVVGVVAVVVVVGVVLPGSPLPGPHAQATPPPLARPITLAAMATVLRGYST